MTTSDPSTTMPSATPAGADPRSLQASISDWLQSELADLLGLDPEDVDPDEPFTSYGLSSVSTVMISGELEKWLGIDLPATLGWDYPTVNELSSHLVERVTAGEEGATADGVAPETTGAVLPLSHGQRALWYVHQTAPGSAAFHLAMAGRARPGFELGAFERACRQLAARHESLRTRFETCDGEPQRHVAPEAEPDVLRLDAREWDEERLREELSNLIAAPFDLDAAPPVRWRLLDVAEDEEVLLFTAHHVAADLWSFYFLMHELLRLYSAEYSGAPSPFSPPATTFSDFVAWEADLLEREGDRLWSFWREELEGDLPSLELPTDRPRPPVQAYRGAARSFELDRSVTDRLEELAARVGGDLYTVLLAVYQTLLHLESGQREVLVGSSTSQRSRAEFAAVVGYLVNPVVLRSVLAQEDASFREHLEATRETVQRVREHQDYPFPLLVQRLKPKRDPSRSPVYQASFLLQQLPSTDDIGSARAPLDFSLIDVPQQAGQVDLDLEVAQTSKGLEATLNYSTDLFDRETGDRLVERFRSLAERVAVNPEVTIRELAGVDAAAAPAANRPKPSGSIRGRRHGRRRSTRTAPSELVELEPLKAEASLPRVGRPTSTDVDLVDWVRHSREKVVGIIEDAGGLLFRGFRVSRAETLRELIAALTGEPIRYTYRSTPRTEVGGSVYTSTEYPSDRWIVLHNEMSYASKWPLRIAFHCVQPAESGGETPIADSRRIYQRVPARVRDLFEKKGVLYVRNYGARLDLPWQEVFQTDNRREVEALCVESGISYEWKEGDRLQTRQTCPAVVRHPSTGEKVWFNQAHLFHVSSMEPEMRRELVASFGEDGVPRNAYLGDGSPIEDELLDSVREVLDEGFVLFPWQRDDILLLDNLLTAHGRAPFSGPREVLVAMGEPMTFDQAAETVVEAS